MNEYHRTITDFLSGHGARDVRLIPGGKHPKVTFTFRDKYIERSVSASPSDVNAANSAIRDLRKLLGEPDVVQPTAPRRLDDMTPTSNGHTAPASMGGVALYGGKGEKLRLRFFPPADVAALIGERVVVTQRMSKDTWLLTPSEANVGRRVRADHKKWQLDAGYAEELTRGYADPFGASPAEYTIIDGAAMVRLLADQIKAVEKRETKKPKIDWAEALKPENLERSTEVVAEFNAKTEGLANPPELPTTANGTHWVEPTLPDPRAVLAAISKVEASTPYRLVRLKDDKGWAWQAPMIKLEEC